MNGFPADWALPTIAQLAIVLGGSDDSFTGDLLHLLGHADPGHIARLGRGFPREVAAWQFWRNTEPAPTAGQLQAHLAELGL